MAIDPAELLQTAMEALKSEIQTISAMPDDVDDPERRSQRLDRAARSMRSLLKEAKELEERQLGVIRGMSTADIVQAIAKDPKGRKLMEAALDDRPKSRAKNKPVSSAGGG